MQKVYLSEWGDDRHNGLHRDKPVRTASKAIDIALKSGASEIKILGVPTMQSRLAAELKAEGEKRFKNTK